MATRVFISYRRDDFLASGVGTLARALGSSNLAKPREDPGISVLMANEEEHIDFPKTQLDLVAKLELELGAQHHIGKLDADQSPSKQPAMRELVRSATRDLFEASDIPINYDRTILRPGDGTRQRITGNETLQISPL